jgi:hypothetical protein
MSVSELSQVLSTLARNGIVLRWSKSTSEGALRVDIWHEDHPKLVQAVRLPLHEDRERDSWPALLYEGYRTLAESLPVRPRHRDLG